MKYSQQDCFREFNLDFSNELRANFFDLYLFFKKNAVDENSLIRKLHLGYTAMRPEAYEYICNSFSWLTDFQKKMGLSNKINFLETHSLEKPNFLPHIDGTHGKPQVMFNFPILNCDVNTITTWVLPKVHFEPVYLSQNASTNDRKKGATLHIPIGTPFDIITEHSFTQYAALFRSDLYHKVENRIPTPSYRIMMQWWFPDDFTWEQAIQKFDGLLKK